MTRTLTILAAVAVLAVSAEAASAGTWSKTEQPSTESYTLSNAMQLAERRASFTIDIGTSEALRNGTVKQPTRSANLTRVKGGSNGIIAVLIGL